MKHLYKNSENELVVADSSEQADTVEFVKLKNQWSQVNDEEPIRIVVTILGTNTLGSTRDTKLAKEWAADYNEPTRIASFSIASFLTANNNAGTL